MADHPVDPAVWDRPDMRAALASRDIPGGLPGLARAGYSQREIGKLTGQAQSEVSDIIHGRREVLAYDLFVQIADGLAIPRGRMGLAYDVDTLIEIVAPPEHEEVDEIVKRRRYLGAVSGLLFGQTYLGGAILGEAGPAMEWERLVTVISTPLPTKIGRADVASMCALTERMRALGRTGHAGMPEVLAPVTRRADLLLTVAEGSEANLKALHSAVAELRTLAGWCAYDLHLTDLATWHYAQAIKLAGDAGDVLTMASAVQHQAAGWRELGAPNDALKLVQMALARVQDAVPDANPSKVYRLAKLHIHAARALADLGNSDPARDQRKRATQLTAMDDPFDRAYLADHDAGIELAIGRLDVAEQYSSTAVRTFREADRRDAAPAGIRLATIHARAGEPDTERLVRQALDAVAGLPSVRGRAMLLPLEQALAARKTSTFTDMAAAVRQVRQGGGRPGMGKWWSRCSPPATISGAPRTLARLNHRSRSGSDLGLSQLATARLHQQARSRGRSGRSCLDAAS